VDGDGGVVWGRRTEICADVLSCYPRNVEDTFGVVRVHFRFDAHSSSTHIVVEQIGIPIPTDRLRFEIIHCGTKPSSLPLRTASFL
jgi:hypothetical protein